MSKSEEEGKEVDDEGEYCALFSSGLGGAGFRNSKDLSALASLMSEEAEVGLEGEEETASKTKIQTNTKGGGKAKKPRKKTTEKTTPYDRELEKKKEQKKNLTQEVNEATLFMSMWNAK